MENNYQEETLLALPPSSFKLLHTLSGHHQGTVNRIAWSPDGTLLATPADDRTICLWSVDTGNLYKTLKEAPGLVLGNTNSVSWSPGGWTLASAGQHNLMLWNREVGNMHRILYKYNTKCVAWSPDGSLLASLSEENHIRLWDVKSGQFVRSIGSTYAGDNCIQWSPNGRLLAMCTTEETLQLWSAEDGQLRKTMRGHNGNIKWAIWSPDGHFIASASEDHTICLWNAATGQLVRTLEGHTASVVNITFSYDGRLLASKALDGSVRFWSTDIWETVVTFKISSLNSRETISTGLAFHPHTPLLAAVGEDNRTVYIWKLDMATLLGKKKLSATHYVNAKIVLVGDSGVGKSGLGLVLAEQPFAPTESTHGRHVWTIDNKELKFKNNSREMRETLLWDLAGQPGYRLIHQLHLNEVAVALVVFDSRSETDPFSGVDHWLRALNVALEAQGNGAPPLKKFLIAARVDRGGISVSHVRINTLVRELGFDGYYETSAKEGWGIEQLTESIKKAIDWKLLPKVSSTSLFQVIKTFLITEKEAGRLLSTKDDLYRTFLASKSAPEEFAGLRAQFETCIGRIESRGLIRRLSFGNLVLLQPELLDSYASALINVVRDEPDGLGSITEEKVRNGRFPMSEDERIKDKELEKLLLIAMIEDLLRLRNCSP